MKARCACVAGEDTGGLKAARLSIAHDSETGVEPIAAGKRLMWSAQCAQTQRQVTMLRFDIGDGVVGVGVGSGCAAWVVSASQQNITPP
jgi:hypothetical protein